MLDYIIVGGGIAGLCFAEILQQNDKSFILIKDNSQNSSVIAAGLYNPVILKRFSVPMDSKKHLEFIKPFYKKIESRLGVKFDYEIPIYRKFTSVQEQNDWFIAVDKPMLSAFLSTEIISNPYKNINAPFGFGVVLHTGFVDTNTFITSYHKYLDTTNAMRYEPFDYSDLIIEHSGIKYNDIEAKNIVFAEGFGIKSNPLFSYLPLDGTKGELIIIKAGELKLDVSLNSGIFILPLGNDLYKVGATYEWDDKTAIPTENGKAEILQKLDEVILCSYEVVNHMAGIRPTVKDRKPLIGTHPEYKNVHLLNGLGTRGVMLGPNMANELYNSIENLYTIPREINLSRFNKLIKPVTNK